MSTPKLDKYRKMSLEQKIEITKDTIRSFYEVMCGKVYIAFSGGKDSTVLKHLVLQLYPDTPLVFSDTGLEYPEIREFCKAEGAIFIAPKMNYTRVIKEHGYAVVSKQTSRKIRDLQNPTEKNEATRHLRMTGFTKSGKKQPHGKLAERWKPLVNSPFKVSERCCDILKKGPFKVYEMETGRKPFIGIRAIDSSFREWRFHKDGCNVYKAGKERSWPLAFWTEDDVWSYIRNNNIPYCKIYDSGIKNTGCMWCCLGIQYDSTPNRFQKLSKTHPKIYNYCINTLKLGEVLEFIGIPYK